MPETKVTRTVVVTDPAGVHARTALAIATIVRGGKSQVTLLKDQQPVAGTDVLQIMTMVAEQGDSVTIEAVGPDADAVLAALEPLFAGRFGDEAQKPA
jgi:phosphotransferase system HPr (HPr) family protein